MIQNINLLQNTNSYKEYAQEYLEQSLQALANAGQRYGLPASNIVYSSFNISDIYSDVIQGSDDYYMKLNVKNANIMRSVLCKFINDGSRIKEIEIPNTEENININNILYTTSTKEIIELLSYIINNISEYHENSIIINDSENNLLTCMLKGKYVETDINEAGELIYFQFDVENNKLLHLIRSSKYKEIDDTDHWYFVNKIDYNDEEENKYTLENYIFSAQELINALHLFMDIDNTSSYTVDEFEKLFIYGEDIINEDGSFKFLSIINPIYTDYNLLVNLQQENSNTIMIDNISFVSLLLYCIVNNENMNNTYKHLIGFKPLNIKKHDEEIVNYQLDGDNSEALKEMSTYFSIDDINEILAYTSNIELLYNKVLGYYSTTVYNKDKKSLYTKIIVELYKKVRKDINYTEYADAFYIPNIYNINYIGSSENKLNLYYSNNLYLTLINKDNIKGDEYTYAANLNELFQTYQNIIYINPNIVNHSSLYNFEFHYNKEYQTIINSLDIIKLYSFPYLDPYNYWVINDVVTDNLSIGDVNSGIKTIYIEESIKNVSNENSFEINYIGLTNDVITYFGDQSKFDSYNITINPLFVNNEDIIENVKIKVGVPHVNENNVDFFSNAVLIIKSDASTIINNIKDGVDVLRTPYLYTVWYVDEQFVCKFLDGTNIAYDPFNNPVLFQQIDESKDWISFKVKINNNMQDTPNQDNSLWCALRNKKRTEYNSSYENDLNFTLEYLYQNINDHTAEYSDNKFINDIETLSFTNVLYPEYREISTTSTTTTLSPASVLGSQTENIINVVYYGDETGAIGQSYVNQYNEVISGVTSTINIITTTSVQQIESSYYNEYVFNDDIPSIDLGEAFIRNSNTINRVNILGLDQQNINSPIYNGFIGTNYLDTNKSTMYIGTTSANINIGNNTLMDPIISHNQLNTFEKLSIIGFKEVESQSPIYENKEISVLNIKYNVKNYQYVPFGSVHKDNYRGNQPLQFVYENDNLVCTNFTNIISNMESSDELFVYITNRTNDNVSNEYLFIYLNKVFKDLNIDITSLGTTKEEISAKINCKPNGVIVCIKDNSIPHIFLSLNDYDQLGNSLVKFIDQNNSVAVINSPINITNVLSNENINSLSFNFDNPLIGKLNEYSCNLFNNQDIVVSVDCR